VHADGSGGYLPALMVQGIVTKLAPTGWSLMARHGSLSRSISALLALAMLAAQSAAVWAGPDCPHHQAAAAQSIHDHHAGHAPHAGAEPVAQPHPHKPCSDCAGHAGMAMDQCVMACLAIAVAPDVEPARLRSFALTSFVLLPGSPQTGLNPEREPPPPKST